MADSKGVRLFKVLRELNVARDTLLQYLKDQGYELEGSGPNARLSSEVYQKVLGAFADEKQAVERHVKRVRELRREGMIEDGLTLEHLDAEGESPPVAEEELPAVEEVLEDVPDVEVEVEAEVEPEPEPELEPEAVEVEVEEAAAEEDVDEVIDDDVEPVAEVETPEEEVVTESTESEETVAQDGEQEVEGEAASDEAPPEDTDDGTLIKAGRYTLSRPRVLGKVDLGSFGESTESQRRRKRKRKKKGEDPPKTDETEPKAAPTDAASKKKRKRKTPVVDQEQVDQAVAETLRSIEQSGSRVRQRRRRMRREEHAAQRQREAEEAQADAGTLRIMEFITASELADHMGVAVTEIIRVCLELGTVVSINQRLDADSITLIADEFNFEVEFVKDLGTDDLVIEDDDPNDLKPRSPVVTVMGHVDHGKTSLLDFIRKDNVVSGESGGITQHIGAYQVEMKDGRRITFLDTPGHQAFTAMRARGAQVTDAVILVVAADDAVMPQTVEAINHAKAAGVPIVVAINKIDKPDANPDKVMQGLSDENVLVEQYGGKVQAAMVSAKTGEGIDDLLEKVLLEAEVLELTANPDREGIGTVIESRVDKGRGVVTTILVQNGTVHQGDTFVVGAHYGRVRAMFDERETRVDEAGPSQPALILGLAGTPEVGDRFIVLDDEREAREIAQGRQQIQREQNLRMRKHITLDDVGRRLALGDMQALNLIVKADVGGSVEALTDALLQLSSDEVEVHIIHAGVGAINEGDVMLASASDAVIIGFQVRPIPGVRTIAEREEIDVRTYSIIYNAIEDVRDALEGMLSPEVSEKTLGTVEVRETFKLPKIGTVAGCYVVEGKIRRHDRVRLIRDGVVIYEGELGSLRRFKDDVKEVTSGYECGLSIERYRDIKVGDLVEAYEVIETRRHLPV